MPSFQSPQPYQRETVLAETQTVLDRPRAVLVEGRRFGRSLRQVIVGLLLRVQLATLQKVQRLVEYAGVAGGEHVVTGRIRQPQVVVGKLRAHAAPAWRMPPVLDVATQELPLGAAQNLLARERRDGVDQGHGVLELIAEPVCATGLVITATTPHAA